MNLRLPDRIDRARQAITPETLPPLVRIALLVLLGATFGVIWFILVYCFSVVKWLLYRLYALGDSTWTSIQIVVSDPDRR